MIKEVSYYMLALLLMVVACSHMSGIEKARTFGYESSQTYMSLHQEYVRLKSTDLPDNAKEFMSEEVAPVMNSTKKALIAYNDAIILWSDTGEKPQDYESLKRNFENLLASSTSLIAQVLTEYVYD